MSSRKNTKLEIRHLDLSPVTLPAVTLDTSLNQPGHVTIDNDGTGNDERLIIIGTLLFEVLHLLKLKMYHIIKHISSQFCEDVSYICNCFLTYIEPVSLYLYIV